jgi:Xaa-Pro dipeptidase
LDAQRKAEALFAEIRAQSLIRPWAKESEINESVYAPAGSMYGISRYWHERILRAGRNTLAPCDENPPDLTVGEDGIVFLDFGPVFEEGEADFGRTYVVGNDPLKHKLRRDIEDAFASGKQYFHEYSEITAAEPYAHAQQLAERAGWEYGGTHCGPSDWYFSA